MPDTIGRFNIIRELGKGAQGSVYLAQDTHLERQVAIKTLRTGHEQSTESLLKEARIVSKLQHPNIVTLYDAGEHEGAPYLVYAYVEGSTLAQLLRNQKTLPLARAAQITCGVLDGIAYAHHQGIMHLDIKPANVMIDGAGQPLIMDFGIARSVAAQSERKTISGTPHYMAPEIITGKGAGFRSDLFSVGMMLYEMVTGAPAASGDDAIAVMRKNASEAAASPSSRNLQVDERLESIILKAIARNPEDRYANAEAMKKALLEYLDPSRDELPSAGGDTHSTLEFLLRRMRSKSDFPALSNTISEINQIVASESESSNHLTRVILQDFALTNKLLRLVNTVSYTQFGGNINTISKAVVILGFDSVRDIAMSLILLDFMQNKSQAAQLKDDVVGSFFAGMVAAQLALGRGARSAEEAMICGMFHNLGRLLATFYFFEESQEVARLVEQGMSETKAALKVLGLTYNELAIGIAKSWSFPERLLAGMHKLGSDKVRKPRGDLEQLTATVNLANELCAIAASTSAEEKDNALRQLSERYQDAVKVSEQQLGSALENGLQEVSKRAAILDIPAARSPLLRKISQWNGEPESPPTEKPDVPDHMAGITHLDTVAEAQTLAENNGNANQPQTDPETVLSAGIQDVTNTLVEDYNLNSVLQMVLETMYRGMRFNRILIFVRDIKSNQMTARFGFGRDIATVLPKFHFPLAFVPDVFHVALEKAVDIVIQDVTAENISSKIPLWYRDGVSAQSFLLLPVMVNGKAVGLFYADMENANTLQVSQRQLSMLRTLRNQAVLAIKQKQ